MKADNIIQIKSYTFALKIVNIYRKLCEEKREFILSKQLLRAGTSIGANVEEAIGGQSKKDFFAKITIAYKEARETHYWIRLLTDAEYLSQDESEIIRNDVEELLKIIAAIQNSLRRQNF